MFTVVLFIRFGMLNDSLCLFLLILKIAKHVQLHLINLNRSQVTSEASKLVPFFHHHMINHQQDLATMMDVTIFTAILSIIKKIFNVIRLFLIK